MQVIDHSRGAEYESLDRNVAQEAVSREEAQGAASPYVFDVRLIRLAVALYVAGDILGSISISVRKLDSTRDIWKCRRMWVAYPLFTMRQASDGALVSGDGALVSGDGARSRADCANWYG